MQTITSMLGFAQASGKLASGEQGVEMALRKGKVRLLIMATDCSENSKQKYRCLAKAHNTLMMTYSSKEELGRVIGKPQRAAVAVLDPGFAQVIYDAYRRGSQLGVLE